MNWKVVALIGLGAVAIAACAATQQETATSVPPASEGVVLRGNGGSPGVAPAATTTGTADGIAVPERKNR